MKKPIEPTVKDKRSKEWRIYRAAMKEYEAYEKLKNIEVESEEVKPTEVIVKKGIGDRIADFTKAIGIKPCEKCKERQALANTLRVKLINLPDENMMEFFSNYSMSDRLEANEVEYIRLSYKHVFGINQSICFHCGSAYKIVTRMVKQLKKVVRESRS